MKKILLIISIISVLFLAGCNKNQDVSNDMLGNNDNQNQENVQNNDENIQNTDNNSNANENNKNANDQNASEDEVTISLKYTDLESLKNQNLLPLETTIGKLYDIGNIKIGNNIYAVKYIATTFEDTESESGVSVEKKLKFYDDDIERLELIVDTENWYQDYIKELSLFKNKYLVTVTTNIPGDTLQYLEIYDEDLNKVKVKYIDNYEDEMYITKDGRMYLNNGYENYYSVNEDDVTYIRTEKGKKVTLSVSEVNGNLGVKIIDESTDGVLEYAGRIF